MISKPSNERRDDERENNRPQAGFLTRNVSAHYQQRGAGEGWATLKISPSDGVVRASAHEIPELESSAMGMRNIGLRV